MTLETKMTDVSRRLLLASGLAATAVPALGASRPTPPAPWGATPSKRQLAWHAREQYAFIHFSINTFTDREWGFGDEDPKLFDPSDFSPDQIVAAAKAGGMRGIILTAKHHDGFCLWPTLLTEHCIRNSPYKNGKGDVVGEMAAATRRAGLAFGLYLSPWDRNHAEYGRPGYITYFRKQIVELCTRYGELFEFWFDGANGGDGYYGGARETRKIDAPRYYDWPSMVALVHQHQPMACTFDPLGADIRWVGNEDGVAGDPCWPTMPNHLYVQAEGNSGVRGAPLWWPAETDVSIRPGWFHHADEDSKVKTPARLLTLYDESVGRGTTLNLNLPPDRRGRLADIDVATLRSFGAAQTATYTTDLARNAVASASHVRGPRFAAANVLDGNPGTYWTAPDAVTTPTLTLELAPGQAFDLIRLREYLPLGLRVTRFAVDAQIDGEWRTLAEKSCIGPQRLIRLPKPIAARKLRLRVLEGPACPAISEVAIFRQIVPVPVVPVRTTASGMIAPTRWSIVAASAPGAQALLDDDTSTSWKSPAPTPDAPASVTIDLGTEETIAGFVLTPSRAVMAKAAPPKGYRVEASLDGKAWRDIAAGELPNIAYALAAQRIGFAATISARWLRFSFAETALPAQTLSIAGLGVFLPRPAT
jgi:alpha-L-fucosidase